MVISILDEGTTLLIETESTSLECAASPERGEIMDMEFTGTRLKEGQVDGVG